MNDVLQIEQNIVLQFHIEEIPLKVIYYYSFRAIALVIKKIHNPG